MNEIVKLALDYHKGTVSGQFSQRDTAETLRKAFVELNGGSETISYKTIRDGKSAGLFAIMEEIIQLSVVDELQNDEFFTNLIEYRNIKLWDQNSFHIPSDSLFIVSEVANGTKSLRRQRLNAGQNITITTKLKGVTIYEELNRVLSGRVDFNVFIDTVTRSFKKTMLEDAYLALQALGGQGGTYFPVTGSYSEEDLVELVDHVEASTGKTATIVGTKTALRKLTTVVQSDSAKNDMYDIGFYGKFNGTNCVKLNQTHKSGTETFLLDANKLYIMATDDKPIKIVTEGEPVLIVGDPMNNEDLSQEFMYAEAYGVGVVMKDKFGIYSMS